MGEFEHSIGSLGGLAISSARHSDSQFTHSAGRSHACLARKAELSPASRVVIVQDSHELQADGFRNRLYIMANVDQAAYTSARRRYGFSDALEDAMRANGDFIVWGEVRDGASAYGLIMAANTGSRGLMTTTHANSCKRILNRFETLLRLEGKTPIREMIAETVQLLVHMKRDPITGQRTVADMQYVNGVDSNDQYILSGAR